MTPHFRESKLTKKHVSHELERNYFLGTFEKMIRKVIPKNEVKIFQSIWNTWRFLIWN